MMPIPKTVINKPKDNRNNEKKFFQNFSVDAYSPLLNIQKGGLTYTSTGFKLEDIQEKETISNEGNLKVFPSSNSFTYLKSFNHSIFVNHYMNNCNYSVFLANITPQLIWHPSYVFSFKVDIYIIQFLYKRI